MCTALNGSLESQLAGAKRREGKTGKFLEAEIDGQQLAILPIYHLLYDGQGGKIEKIGSTSGLNPGGDFFAYKLKV